MTKLAVIGDYISDKYVFGTAARLCPEAPVPVLIPQVERTSAGGAGLVADQLVELGADVHVAFGSFSFKERYFAGNHLICRVDRDSESYTPIELSDLEGADAYVIADYGKGAMTRELASQIVSTLKPVFVDAKHHWDWYTGPCSVAFPNEHEIVDAHHWVRVAQKLGAKGAMLIGESITRISAMETEVVDTTGAGDIFMAAFVYAWSEKFTPEGCLRFANALAGESCRHVGTYVVPRAFAQAYLDRLRASEGSGPQGLVSSPDSSPSEPPQQPSPDQSGETLDATLGGTLPEYFPGGVKVTLGVSRSLPPEQIRHPLPSAPTELSDTRIRGDRENSGSPRKRWP